jgi:hypothetical protein
MKYAILENNIVTNIIEASSEFIESADFDYISWIDGLNIGDTYINGQITKPEPEEEIIPDAEISRFKIVLYRSGILAGIETYMAGKNGETAIWWNNVKTISFYHTKVQEAITELSLDIETVKNFFRQAQEIE